MPVIPERIRWAVARLGLAGDERVLELGCGHGLAADLICRSLTTGRLTAVDRSPAMIRRASRRNAGHVADGMARFVVAPIAGLDLAGPPADLVLAMDVNVFGGRCEAELDAVRRHMHPRGVLHLVHRPPAAGRVEVFSANLAGALPAAGFRVEDLTVEEVDGARTLAVRAAPARAPGRVRHSPAGSTGRRGRSSTTSRSTSSQA